MSLNVSFRSPLLQVLIGFFELPEDETTFADDHYVDVEDTPGYQAVYSQLAYANRSEHDPLPSKYQLHMCCH